MTPLQYSFAVSETANYTDRDAYISDLALSAIWGDDGEDIPAQRLDELTQIWDAANRPVDQILAVSGLSQANFYRRFLIPRRTLQDWCAGKRPCPIYTRMMFQQLLGLLTIEIC